MIPSCRRTLGVMDFSHDFLQRVFEPSLHRACERDDYVQGDVSWSIRSFVCRFPPTEGSLCRSAYAPSRWLDVEAAGCWDKGYDSADLVSREPGCD
jgi:hypothetical protein